MFGLGFQELLLIMIVALVIFGPRRLPEVGKLLGKAMGEFRRATDDFKNTIEREVHAEEIRQIHTGLVTPVDAVSRSEPVVTPPVKIDPPPGEAV